MKPLTDKECLDLLEFFLDRLPDLTIENTRERGTEDELGLIPVGWNFRVPNNCAPGVALNAPTFRGLLEKCALWKEMEEHPEMHTQQCSRCLEDLLEPSSPQAQVQCLCCGCVVETDFEESFNEETQNCVQLWWVRRSS